MIPGIWGALVFCALIIATGIGMAANSPCTFLIVFGILEGILLSAALMACYSSNLPISPVLSKENRIRLAWSALFGCGLVFSAGVGLFCATFSAFVITAGIVSAAILIAVLVILAGNQ
jgi:hypothetical protein